MTNGSISKQILNFALPIFLGDLFQQLYSTVDSIIVGNYVSSNALAAISSTASLIYLLIGFFLGFSSGAGIVISHWIGANDAEKTSKAVHTTVAMGIFFAVFFTFVGVLGAPLFTRWLQTPADVLEDSTTYLRIYFAGSAALVLYNTFVGILQAAGDSRHPLYYLIISSILNIFLDLLFIRVFNMGVAGAALGTVLAELLSMVLSMRRLLRATDETRLIPRKIAFDRTCLTDIQRYGFPSAMQSCVIDLSNTLIQSYINSFGSAAMAGIGAYHKVEGFCFLPISAFCIAMSTFLSQNIGAGETERAKQGIKFGYAVSLISTESIGALMYLLAEPAISLFTKDPEVIAYGVDKVHICTLAFGLLAFSHMSSAIMRGTGRPILPMVVMLVCWCGVRVGVLMTIGQVYHTIALANWLYPITWTLSTVIYLINLKNLDLKNTL